MSEICSGLPLPDPLPGIRVYPFMCIVICIERGSVAGPGPVNIEVPVVVSDPGAQPLDLRRAHALPPLHLAKGPQVRAGAQQALHRRHRQLVAL